ncbi:MAG: conjugal transfer protein TraX [Bacteroidales bacterium]|nr:conjugal transfer protein TraX [Bacteroidales bacterium]
MNLPQNLNSFRILSGSALKLLAVVSMLIDHLAAFYWYNVPALQAVWFTIGHRAFTPLILMRIFGRIAFPLFAFLIVEGFVHTRSRKRYGLNLAFFALISEIPWNLIHTGTMLYPGQNVFFTLLLGFLGLCAIEKYSGNKPYLLGSLLGLLVVSIFLRADYGCSGYGFILLLYVLRDNKILQAIIGSCVLGSRWIAGLAFIPINMYNGKRGFVKGPVWKYAFYLFYPLHLLAIWLMR